MLLLLLTLSVIITWQWFCVLVFFCYKFFTFTAVKDGDRWAIFTFLSILYYFVLFTLPVWLMLRLFLDFLFVVVVVVVVVELFTRVRKVCFGIACIDEDVNVSEGSVCTLVLCLLPQLPPLVHIVLLLLLPLLFTFTFFNNTLYLIALLYLLLLCMSWCGYALFVIIALLPCPVDVSYTVRALLLSILLLPSLLVLVTLLILLLLLLLLSLLGILLNCSTWYVYLY